MSTAAQRLAKRFKEKQAAGLIDVRFDIDFAKLGADESRHDPLLESLQRVTRDDRYAAKYPNIMKAYAWVIARDSEFMNLCEFFYDAVTGKVVGLKLENGSTRILDGAVIGGVVLDSMQKAPRSMADSFSDVIERLDEYGEQFLRDFEDTCSVGMDLVKNFDSAEEPREPDYRTSDIEYPT